VIKEPYSTLIEKLLRLLKEKFGDDLISVAVYGSVARGDYRNDSDIDLIIIARNLPFSITERIKIFDSIEALLEADIMELYSIRILHIFFTYNEDSRRSKAFLSNIYGYDRRCNNHL